MYMYYLIFLDSTCFLLPTKCMSTVYFLLKSLLLLNCSEFWQFLSAGIYYLIKVCRSIELWPNSSLFQTVSFINIQAEFFFFKRKAWAFGLTVRCRLRSLYLSLEHMDVPPDPDPWLQLPARKTQGWGISNGSSNWVPPILWGRVSSSLFQPWPSPAVLGTWGLNQQMGALFVYPSLLPST